MDDKVRYWLDISDYDLETAEAMLKTKRFLYVGFMCHQSIEKIFKAYYAKLKGETPPFSHSLSFLATKGEFFETLSDDQKNFVDELEPLNIETRYPSYKERLLKSLTQKKCTGILEKTKELQKWIRMKL
jgi:HEPN domain-containing protein